MRHRMVVASLALAGLLLSVYLTLYHAGLVGALACGASASCERVQLGRYGSLLGLPVAAYGIAGYLGILAVALAGLQPRWETSMTPTRLLVLLSGMGVAFTLYLKYLELFVIRAVCRWCVVSAVLITVIFLVSLLSLRIRPSASPPPTGQPA
jgi:uncharacterized membrane protein